MPAPREELQEQWANPSDILSLLLLVGGDVVQKAIAQMAGPQMRVLPCFKWSVSIVPVAFSFGWVAYGFSNLLAACGDMRLMPRGDYPAILVNCSNGFVRETRSWIQSRLLRDHVSKHEIDPRDRHKGGRAESLRIDIFEMGPVSRCSLDWVWWLGWAVIVVQAVIAVLPWALFGNWGPFLVTASGNLLSTATCALPQWQDEKWAGRKLGREKVTCLTQGNGSHHIMVFLAGPGSWDFESLATGTSRPRPETRWVSLLLTVLWTCLLISVSGLGDGSWFLVLVGGIGMVQNVLAAGTSRMPRASGIHLTPYKRAPTIIGRRETFIDDGDARIDEEEDLRLLHPVSEWLSERSRPANQQRPQGDAQPVPMPPWLASMSTMDGVPEWLEAIKPVESGLVYANGVQGALIELEKWVPTAGLSMIPIFFPGGLSYNDEAIRYNMQRKFWKRAFATRSTRQEAEKHRRKENSG